MTMTRTTPSPSAFRIVRMLCVDDVRTVVERHDLMPAGRTLLSLISPDPLLARS